MKKLLLLITLAVSAIAFQSCDDDKNENNNEGQEVGLISEIKITDVKEVNKNISKVVFVGRTTDFSKDQSERVDYNYFMLTFPYNEKGMTIQLPQNPPQSLLRNIQKDIPEGFNISDTSAKTIAFVAIGCCTENSDNILGGIVYYKTSDEASYRVEYIYCDRPVKITGTAKDWWGNKLTYNLQLEKGWNMTVQKTEWEYDKIRTITNFLPTGMSWHYEGWY